MLVVVLLLAAYLLGLLDLEAFATAALLIVGFIVLFYAVFRSGLNLRFSDPSLTLPQIVASNLVILYALYQSKDGQGILALVCMLSFLFGVFRLSTRELLTLTAFVAFSYALIIAVQWYPAADADPGRRSWLAGRAPGGRIHDELEALLEDPAVAAIVVALPTALHAEVACRAFAAGKHVFVEKPIALSQDEGRRVVTAWRQAGTTGAIGYNFRRNPIVEAARQTLASGPLGELVAIQGSFHWAADRIEGWRAQPGMGGGVLLDLVSHHVDLVSALSGANIVQVQCTLRSVRTPDDSASVQLVTDAGLTAQLQASSAAGAPGRASASARSRGSTSAS